MKATHDYLHQSSFLLLGHCESYGLILTGMPWCIYALWTEGGAWGAGSNAFLSQPSLPFANNAQISLVIAWGIWWLIFTWARSYSLIALGSYAHNQLLPESQQSDWLSHHGLEALTWDLHFHELPTTGSSRYQTYVSLWWTGEGHMHPTPSNMTLYSPIQLQRLVILCLEWFMFWTMNHKIHVLMF
jgi:hypothetical protein